MYRDLLSGDFFFWWCTLCGGVSNGRTSIYGLIVPTAAHGSLALKAWAPERCAARHGCDRVTENDIPASHLRAGASCNTSAALCRPKNNNAFKRDFLYACTMQPRIQDKI